MPAADAPPPSAADVAALRAQVLGAGQGSDAEGVKAREEAIGQLSDAYVKLGDAAALTELLAALRPFFAGIPKAKTAKLVRNIIDQIARIPGSTDIQVWRMWRTWRWWQ
jgi:26S proteasome regulatory subunit N6